MVCVSPKPSDIPVASACSVPLESLRTALSFVVRSHCLWQLGPVSQAFSQLTHDALTWQGASGMLRAMEIEHDGRLFAEKLIPRWALLQQVFVDFKNVLGGIKRQTVRRCFSSLGEHCCKAEGLFVRNWCLMERDGLAQLCDETRFSNLHHLELSNCDYLSYANATRVLQAHPNLLSLRATFSPNAIVTPSFVDAQPKDLMALGFVNFGEDANLLELALSRSSIEHLWFARTAGFTEEMAKALIASPTPLRTLCLPEAARVSRGRSTNDVVIDILRECHSLELIHFWGSGLPAEQVVTEGFDIMPVQFSSQVVLRRKGSMVSHATNGALWAPYSCSDVELINSVV
eukprot:TRINITY_DN39139_c0_g1_i1.p1 TRINITY_DN39139_c0_g1~~TRINITY_DN39139_c0_g1_i1.p1  ORF type:complete len:360 (-),score=44.94 TRINITY_DN39139_c0_g1_i1:31-1065(-)